MPTDPHDDPFRRRPQRMPSYSNKLRAADQIVAVFAGQRRMDVHANAEKFLDQVLEVLMEEGLML